MRFINVLQEAFTEYKIEKWNEKKECWEFFRHFYCYPDARKSYYYILKENEGIFRLIKLLELNDRCL